MEEEATFWIGFYTHEGSEDKVKGNWKTSETDVNEEAESYLYKRQLGLTLLNKGKIAKSVVEKIARENNCTVSAVLSTI